MKRKLLSLLVLVFCISAIGQDSKVEIENLNEEICNLKNEVSSYKRQFTNQNVKVNSIERKQDESIKDIESLKKEVITVYDSLEESKKTLHEEISSTKEKLCDNQASLTNIVQTRTIMVIILFITIIILSAIVVIILRKKISSNISTMERIHTLQEKLQEEQKKLKEESLSLDNKMIEIIEKQVTFDNKPTETVDHSLVLKVADEITRIELNLSRMDSSIKGYKQLTKGIERIKNNYMAKGYEISDMLGKPYNEGMRINADFVLDENMESGTRLITSITKPQVIYKGEMIQKAIVTVTQNI